MSDEGPRVFDGRQWVTVAATSEPDDTTASPVKQVVDGDGKIFVSIASYRGTCRSSIVYYQENNTRTDIPSPFHS